MLNETSSEDEHRVAVVIVTHDSSSVIDGCIESLGAAFDHAPLEVVVVDSGSTDGTPGRVRARFPNVGVLELGANRGFGAGINAGAASLPASHDLLVLNADVRLEPGSGTALVAGLDDTTGICVPRLVGDDGELQHSLRRDPSVGRSVATAMLGGARSSRLGRRFPGLSESIVDASEYTAQHSVDWATGAVLLISAPCRAAVGSWDESYFLYSEETDYCQRARREGFTVEYVPTSTAVHIGGESTTSPELWSILMRNKVTLHRRNSGMTAAAAVWSALVLGESVRSLAGSRRSRASLRELLSPRARRREVREARAAVPGWICFSAQDWWYFNRGHSDFQLMTEMARDRDVLFVNSIGMRMPTPGKSTQFTRRLVRKARSSLKGLRRPLPNRPRFVVLSPLILPFYGADLGRRVNAALVRAQVRAAARWLGIDDPVIMVTIPTAWEVARAMPRRALVFNRSDKHSAFDQADRGYIGSLETALLDHSDAIVYVSDSLMAEDAARAGDRSHFLDHGVDLERFRRRPAVEIPEDIAAIDGPIIGFFGGISDYVVDLELLRKVARRFTTASLVLIGDATCPLGDLEHLPNVHLLGKKPYETIPAYGSAFDVALMPWLQNEWIAACNPIKTKEYLALGLPVVTMAYPQAATYGDLMAIARSHDEFLDAIERVLAGHHAPPAACRASVLDASWDARARQLGSIGSVHPGR